MDYSSLGGLATSINPALGLGLNVLGSFLGHNAAMGHLQDTMDNLQSLPGMEGPANLAGSFGSSQNGVFNLSPELAALQSMSSGMGTGLMSGGLFNSNPLLQQAMGSANFTGALGQLDQATANQMGNSAFGGLGQQYLQSQGMMQQLGNMAMQGPQDYSGGMMGQMNMMGMGNMQAATNQQGLYNQSLATMRAAAEPFNQAATNSMMDRLHGMGMLGSTGGASQMEALFNSQQQADLGFQNQAFQNMMGQQTFLGNMGAQQAGLGQGYLGQNLNQYNSNVGNFLGMGQYGMGLEGQQFGQNLQAMDFNTLQAMNRLNTMGSFFGMGNEAFLGNIGAGAGLGNLGLGFGEFGLMAAANPYQLQASLLQGSGEHAGAQAQMGQAMADASGSFFGGLFG